MLSAKKITLSAALTVFTVSTLLSGMAGIYAAAPVIAQSATTTDKTQAKPAEKAEKKEPEKKEAVKTPEPPIEGAVSVTPDDLVKHPHEYLNKTIKFNANFSSFSTLALDYKPAMKPSKTYLSFLVLTPGTHIPLSELKLAMSIPKEKDPASDLLTKLKDGDQLEIIGKEFSTALDDPWVEILRLKKIGGSKDEDKKVASEGSSDKSSDKSKDGKESGGADEKSE
jgi:hypothetical protein